MFATVKNSVFGLGLCLLTSQGIHAQVSPLLNHESTDISINEGNELWNSMRDDFVKDSECYNRAHTWTYDANREFGYEAKKILIHYSLKYNQELSSKWGFHIAPVYKTEGKDMVYDKGFQPWIHAPINKQMWEEKFLGAGTQKLIEKRIKLMKKINKLEKQNASLNPNLEEDRLTLKANKKWLAEYRAELIDFKITDAELKKQKPKKIERIKHWIEYYKTEIENYEGKRPRLVRGLRQKLKNQVSLLKKVQTDLNYAAHIQCKKITHIEELDFNLNGAWCYIQEVSQYYWGIPQLRQLNYGVDRIRHIPSRNNLVEAYREGEKYQRFDFEMNQVWAARKQAFKNYDSIWSEEWDLKEQSREAVADIWDVAKGARANIKKANKLFSKIVKAASDYRELETRVTRAQEYASSIEKKSIEIDAKKDDIYTIANSIVVADTKQKVADFKVAAKLKAQADRELDALTNELAAIKSRAKEIKKEQRAAQREQRRLERERRRNS